MSGAGQPAAAGLAVVVATTAGLFLMHTMSAAPIRGCQGGSDNVTAMVQTATPPDVPSEHAAVDRAMHAMVVAPSVVDGATTTSNAAEAGSPNRAGHGDLCLSMSPRSRFVSALILLVGIDAVAPVHPGAPRHRESAPDGQRLRAPPLAGAALLVAVCVSRT